MKLPTDNTPTFIDVKEGRIQTYANCEDLQSLDVDETPLLWSNQSTREYLASDSSIKCLPFDTAYKLHIEADNKRYNVGTIKETTEENFFEKLNCLPPEDWTHSYSSSESFRMCEAMTNNLYSYYIRVSDGYPVKQRYFSTIADRFKTDHQKLVQLVREQFKVEVIA